MENAQLRSEISRDEPYRLCLLRLLVHNDDRRPLITADADASIDRNFSQEWNLEFSCRPASAAAVEYILPMSAVTADIVAHVLDNAQDWNVHLVKHHKPFSGIG